MWNRLPAFAAMAAASLALPAAAVTVPPVADYAKLPAAENVRLSPQGDKIAYLAFTQGKRAIVAQSVDGHVLVAANAGDQKLRYLVWADDTHLILGFDAHVNSDALLGYQGDVAESVVINVQTGKSFGVFASTPHILKTTFGYFGHAGQGGHVFGYFGGITLQGGGTGAANFDMRRYSIEHAHTDLYKVDLDTGATDVVSGGSEKLSTSWLVDSDGQIVARDDYDQKSGERRIYADAGEQLLLTRFSDPTGDHGVQAQGRTRGSVLVHQRAGQTNDWTKVEYPRGGGDAVDPFAGQEMRFELTDSHGLLMGGVTNSEQPKTVLFDPSLQGKWDRAARAFKGEQSYLAGATDNLER